MVKAELGTKRTCPSCGTRFYDLHKSPIACPHCGVTFIAATLLPSKTEMPHQAPAPKPREAVVDDAEVSGDVELVSLEEVEEGAPEDDEAAVIQDVDLGEEEEAATDTEDEAFLVEDEEENSDVTGYLDSGPAAKEGPEEEP
ncbi:TIGR02300 family protein [soil metagenome]